MTTIPFPDPMRRADAKRIRNEATELSTEIAHPDPPIIRDEKPPYVFSFTKGIPHHANGMLMDPSEYELFINGTKAHDPREFAKVVPFGDKFLTEDISQFEKEADAYRQWESPTAGHAYVMEGPDPFSVTMPEAPVAGSAEFAAEMAEVYQMALSRDWPIASFMSEKLISSMIKTDGGDISNACRDRLERANRDVKSASERLGGMRWFQGEDDPRDTPSAEHRARRRFDQASKPKGVSSSTMFRGEGEDGWETPFLSQFMVMGSGDRASGRIAYGAQAIEQKVNVAIPNKDYMTRWAEWADIQNGLNKRYLVKARGEEVIDGATRYISRLRDLATYVHDDQLYQAYLNAALILLSEEYPFDPGIPYHHNSANPLSRANREPFALFGGPHLLTLVTEVSSRALKAVRLQKFSIHRRLRPEAAGALFHTIYSGYHPDREIPGSVPYPETGTTPEALARQQLGRTLATYTFPQDTGNNGSDPVLDDILTDIRIHNAKNNNEDENDFDIAKWLLPMAFAEGSPMHPAYGAGHATVAGACVTLLKAFFNMRHPKKNGLPAYLVKPGGMALVPDGGTNSEDCNGEILGVPIAEGLTLEGELNKLMWNISNARNIAGVHYYTDYIESALIGEAITIGILREQMKCYHAEEDVSMTVPLVVPRTLPATLLNGGSDIRPDQEVDAVRINRDGVVLRADPTPGRS